VAARIDTVDLDRAGYELFRAHCPAWISSVNWQQADAVEWLHAQPKHFDLLVEDLSVPDGQDVFKPSISWDVLPALMRDRLAPDGVAVFNLLPPQNGIWIRQVECMAELFGVGRLVAFDDFENRILVAGSHLPSARELGASLREALKRIRSRQAGRIQVRTVRGTADRTAS
jgi:spermidine synthase